ncbi:MAG: HAD-IIIA family hydrolase [Elusimicrobiota bacterium]|jgi:D-glycero-D-manno-heptose 1,7-bisphosphate phosphatase|nr:HAD-IIIA family hydrolase [Elusimicrobiota bacterium]
MDKQMQNKAVFLDRDGVINPLVYNTDAKEYESPHSPEDFSLYPFVLKSLQTLKANNFKIIIVSNQPSFAKGKTAMENLKSIEKLFEDFSIENGRLIDDFYYCYHHPKGIIPEYSCICNCRKPGILFPQKSVKKYNLAINQCFFVGDCDIDIECGQKMGFKTIKINNKRSANKSLTSHPDKTVENLYEAVLEILKYQ